MLVPKTTVSNCCPTIEDEMEYIVKSIDTAIFNDKKTEMFVYSSVMTGTEIKNSNNFVCYNFQR
jgi:hypothetical protein